MLADTVDGDDELFQELKLEARIRSNPDLTKILDNLADENGYLKATPRNDLDDIGHFIKVVKLINEGGQSLIFEGQIDWSKVQYEKFFTHILAHELAKMDSLESKLREKKLTLEDTKKIDINDDLKAAITLNNKDSLELIADYSIKEIRKSGPNYISQAKKIIEEPDQKTVNYLIQRGYLKKNQTLDSSTIQKIVKDTFSQHGLFKNGKCVIKVSKLQQVKDPRSRREQNFAGLLHENSVYIGLYTQAYGGRSVYINDFFENKFTSEEMAKTFTLDQSLELTKAIARMIVLFKNLGAVNRDIKPDNVASDGKIHKLLDYGLADYNIEDIFVAPDGTFRTGDGQLLGTPNFMPPEQLIGKRKAGDLYVFDAGIRNDFYTAMGTLYYLITGQAPNPGESINKVLANIEDNVLPDLPDLKKIKSHYLKKQGWKAKVAGLFTNHYRNKAEQYAHDFVFAMAAGLQRDRGIRYPDPELLRDDLAALIGLNRPTEALRRFKDEFQYQKGAFRNPQARPKHSFRKMRHLAYVAAGAATTLITLAPDFITSYLPEKAYQHLETINQFVQKII